MNKADILRKLASMKALAHDPATTEAMRENILAKMNKWMEEYNLTLTDIDVREEGITTSGHSTGEDKKGAHRHEMAWITPAITALTNTKLVMPSKHKYIFVGNPVDVAYADFLFSVCYDAIENSWNAYFYSFDYRMLKRNGTADMKEVRRTFRNTMMYALRKRIDAMAPPKPVGTGIVLVKTDLINAFMKEKGLSEASNTTGKDMTVVKRHTGVAETAIKEANKVKLRYEVGNPVAGYLTKGSN